MAGVRLEIFWSPNSPEKFLTCGCHGTSEIILYQIEHLSPTDEIPSHYVRLSPNAAAYQLASFTDVTFVKCLAWLPSPQVEGFVAFGQTNGRVLLTSVLGNAESLSFNGIEYASKHNRQCNALAWGVLDSNILAAGFDKHRSEYGILVWDVCKTGLDSAKPVVEFAFGEPTASLAWFNQSQTIVAGVNNKHLRVYDLRDGTKTLNLTNTRAVYGVQVDPFVPNRIASYGDSTVCIWDLRNFEKPVLSLQQNKPISKISWCPTRSSFLGVLCKESNSLSLYDIQNTNGATTEEMEPTTLERGVTLTDGTETISSFAWHLAEENRMLYTTSLLNIKDHLVFDRITLNWSPSSKLVWNFGKRILQYIDETDSIYDRLDDVSVTMRRRAVSGYGLEADFQPNSELMQEPSTRELWFWIDTCRKLNQTTPHTPTHLHFTGVRAALKLDTGASASSTPSTPSAAPLDSTSTKSTDVVQAPVNFYRNEERSQALRLCGWPYDREASTSQQQLGPLLDKLEEDGQISRAAALAVFHLKIRKAIKILTRAGQQKNDISSQLVALALAGFTDNRDALWQEMCAAQCTTLGDPYLRAAFAFLTSPSEKYELVLTESGISVRDRIGFACTFLSDSHLSEYIEQLTQKQIEEGNLDGMLLTGLTNDGLNLLQNYVDRTGDIQTVSLLSLHTSTQEVSKDFRMMQWVNSYRSLLDSWRLWTQRAKFDVLYYKGYSTSAVAEKSPQQVYVSCNFCGKSVSVYLGNKGRISLSRPNPNMRSKLTGCPNCRNPLPRCAVCMMHLGGPLASWGGTSESKKTLPISSFALTPTGGPGSGASEPSGKSQPFSSWFLWCQNCRHGGHSSHLLQWFNEHPECPVTGCTCRCLNLDSIGHQIPLIAHAHE